VDAQGNILAHGYNGEAVLIADIDVELSRRWRRSLPYLRDRRPEVYLDILQSTPDTEVAPGIPSNRVMPVWRSRV
jgi:hypothetical protein